MLSKSKHTFNCFTHPVCTLPKGDVMCYVWYTHAVATHITCGIVSSLKKPGILEHLGIGVLNLYIPVFFEEIIEFLTYKEIINILKAQISHMAKGESNNLQHQLAPPILSQMFLPSSFATLSHWPFAFSTQEAGAGSWRDAQRLRAQTALAESMQLQGICHLWP